MNKVKINNTSLIRVLFGRQVSNTTITCVHASHCQKMKPEKTHSVYELRPVFIPVSFTRLKAQSLPVSSTGQVAVCNFSFKFKVSFVIFS